MSKVGLHPPSAIKFMELALEQANSALERLEVPIGCVIVEDGQVIASGSNRTTETRNALRHAEMEAIDFLLEKWQNDGLDQVQIAEKFSKCDLYVTCEPCIMCASALSILGIREVFYGCANDKFGGCGSILPVHQADVDTSSCKQKNTFDVKMLHQTHRLRQRSDPERLKAEICSAIREKLSQGRGFKCTGGIMANEAVALLRSFYEQGNPNAPKPHRPLKVQQSK